MKVFLLAIMVLAGLQPVETMMNGLESQLSNVKVEPEPNNITLKLVRPDKVEYPNQLVIKAD